jgi:hypothetical protein
MLACGLALSLFGCEKLGREKNNETGIRGRVLVGTGSWVPKPGEMMCASQHEMSKDPPWAKVGRDETDRPHDRSRSARPPDECPEGSTPDPLGPEELE